MNSKFLKLLTLTVGLLALSAAFVSAEEKKGDGKCPNCPCEKEKPKAIVSEEPKKDDKCPCEKEKPKALVAADEPSKDGKCPCEKEKPKA
ncbi:MAG: hypothetical protein RJA95_3 [Verrucomicrobiota bacterium]|jgi:hypothetical protein